MTKAIFALVAGLLYGIAGVFGITYFTVNILVYYLLIPLTWTLMCDYVIGKPFTTIALGVIWVLIFICTASHFQAWCDKAFQWSVDFLLWFRRIGWNYVVSSVIICVVVPIIIYGVLGWFYIQKAGWTTARPWVLGIGGFILFICIASYLILRFGTKLEATSNYTPAADISWIRPRLADETRGMNAEEILDYAEKETCKIMSFEMHGNRISTGNCIDDANMCGTICNLAFRINGIKAHAVRSKGTVKILGIDACKLVSMTLRSGGNSSFAAFVTDHDFVTVTTDDGNKIITDPSIKDVLGINLRKKQ